MRLSPQTYPKNNLKQIPSYFFISNICFIIVLNKEAPDTRPEALNPNN